MQDEFAWLEDIEGEAALGWVRDASARTESLLFTQEIFRDLRAATLEVLQADDRIPMPSRHGDSVLNFWTDSEHPRGILRRTSWKAYLEGGTDWETLLDIDELGKREGRSWVYRGSSVRRPDRRRAIVELSPGGTDSSVSREFDLAECRFLSAEEEGFVRPEAKGWLRWADEGTVYVGHDFGTGSTTTSGYPRTVRRWRRGDALANAEVVFEVAETDVSAGARVDTLPGHRHHLFYRAIDFYRARHWILRGGDLVEIPAPLDADVDVRETWIMIRLRSDWSSGGRTYRAGSLLAADLADFLAGEKAMEVLFEPSPRSALAGYRWLRHHLLLVVQEDVRHKIEVLTPSEGWHRQPLAGAPPVWSLGALAVDADSSDELLLLGEDFLHPTTLYLSSPGQEPLVLRQAPKRFEDEGLTMSQHFASSRDGTSIPYFLVAPQDAASGGPTLLTGYGGFEISHSAEYSGVVGLSWLSRGGRYAVANIRGGGEYGPKWHEAALRENRPRAYEDFEAVARDLIDRGVTTSDQLGIMGGSNGGLLVGNMYVRSPEIFGAVVCRSPLLDMRRYSHLLAGASWIAEYGDPDDPSDWEFIQTFSPYHLVEPGRDYPPLLLVTSTKDDRVHPGHARKMAAALDELGYDVSYWENTEGGHSAAADATQQATMAALVYTFLHHNLAGPKPSRELSGKQIREQQR